MTSWIKNTGVKPVEGTVRVEVSLVNGAREDQVADFFRWDLDEEDEGNIAYYRVWSEQFLETAYDAPPKSFAEHAYYRQPVTNFTPAKAETAKRSIPQLVSDSFNQLSGKHITAAEVESIITLHEVMKRMEN